MEEQSQIGFELKSNQNDNHQIKIIIGKSKYYNQNNYFCHLPNGA